MAEEKKSAFKKIAAAKTMKKIMAEHFYGADNAAKEGQPKVAWCTSVGPAELLNAMGYACYLNGAMREARDLITRSLNRDPDQEKVRRLLTAIDEALARGGVDVERGSFGDYMDVKCVNAGPVCILLDSQRVF